MVLSIHVDRCEAVVENNIHKYEAVGMELRSESKTYGWINKSNDKFKK